MSISAGELSFQIQKDTSQSLALSIKCLWPKTLSLSFQTIITRRIKVAAH
jgi:hypothetical protein